MPMKRTKAYLTLVEVINLRKPSYLRLARAVQSLNTRGLENCRNCATILYNG